jgi:hypothetical protein
MRKLLQYTPQQHYIRHDVCLENNRKLTRKLNPHPPLKKNDGTYAKAPTEGVRVMIPHVASTSTPHLSGIHR